MILDFASHRSLHTDPVVRSRHDFFLQQLNDFCKDRPEPVHDRRYAFTMQYIELVCKTLLNKPAPAAIMELGGESTLTELMRLSFGSTTIRGTDWRDVRDFEPPNAGVDRWFDIVLCTEVIEHVHDFYTDEPNNRAQWTASGQAAMLDCIKPWMADDGYLILTTPLTNGYGSLWNLVRGGQPMTYEPHVRELSWTNLKCLLEHTGFEIVEHGLWNCWDHHGVPLGAIRKMRTFFISMGYEPPEGDDMVVLAKLRK